MTEEITQPLQTIEEKENKALSLMQERKYREAVEMWSEVLEKKYLPLVFSFFLST